MNEEQLPENIYHYTSIETLALILESKKIRFNRLDIVMDPEEGSNIEDIDISKNVMVSCWTAESNENIPMWVMYTGPKLDGVRICAPSNVFEIKQGNVENVNDAYLWPLQKVTYGKDIDYSLIKENLTDFEMHKYGSTYLLYP
ncbi:hypothetical protein ACFLQJ_02525, partial [Calditrichota bacterium]